MKQFNFLQNGVARIKGIIHHNLMDSSVKVMDLTNRFSIRNRLIIFFLLASLGPMLIVGTISYISSRSAINSKISKYSQKELSQTTQNLEIKLKSIEDISKQFIALSQYNKILKEYVSAQETIDVFDKQRAIDDLLQSITFSGEENGAIIFMSMKDPARFSANNSLGMTSQWVKSFSNSRFYKNILSQEGRAVWFPVKSPQNDIRIAMARVIKDPLIGDSIGVMVIFLKESVLSDVINTMIGTEDESNLENNFTMIVDNKGLVLFSPFAEDINKPIQRLLSNPGKILPLLKAQKDQDNFMVKLKNKHVRIIGQKIPDQEWFIFNVAKTSYLYSESNLVGLITLCLGVFFGLIAIFISIAIALSISKPLNQVIFSMQRAEKGDLTVRANIKRRDELGFLGATFDHMIEQIGGLLKETQNAVDAFSEHSLVLDQSADQSVKAAEAVAAAMEEITKGTMEQTNEAEKSSTTMNDLASQIEVVVSKATEVEQISGSTRELSLKSQEAVDKLIQKTNETDQITQTIIENIIGLHSSADRIRQITEMITSIAEQTNLLGLNASIEAARAGEMGQGFAVVSEEINKLALQSRDAAKTINSILQEIQGKTEISTKTAEEAHQILEEQRSAVNFAQEAFTEIAAATGNVIARIIFMNHLINNINHSKNHTVQSIMSISSISEETAASAEEVSASSEEQTALADQVRLLAQDLRNRAEELAGVIKKFQV